MKSKHHTQKPKTNHAPCEKKGCDNYFNINYKQNNGKCKPCNKRRNNEDDK